MSHSRPCGRAGGGWERHAAKEVVRLGYTAVKFDPSGSTAEEVFSVDTKTNITS